MFVSDVDTKLITMRLIKFLIELFPQEPIFSMVNVDPNLKIVDTLKEIGFELFASQFEMTCALNDQ